MKHKTQSIEERGTTSTEHRALSSQQLVSRIKHANGTFQGRISKFTRCLCKQEANFHSLLKIGPFFYFGLHLEAIHTYHLNINRLQSTIAQKQREICEVISRLLGVGNRVQSRQGAISRPWSHQLMNVDQFGPKEFSQLISSHQSP